MRRIMAFTALCLLLAGCGGEDAPEAAAKETPATGQEAAPPEGSGENAVQEREAVKAKVKKFADELMGYDLTSSVYLENAKAMANRLGKGKSQVDLYQALDEAHRYAKAGADLALQAALPDGLPEPVAGPLGQAKEAYWQMFSFRARALDRFKEFLDTHKPSAGADMQEQSGLSTLQAAKAAEAVLTAKKAAGFTDQELAAEMKAPASPPAKAKKSRR